MDMVSLPICNIVLKGLKPNRKPYPKALKTFGDHIRKRRLDLDLSQREVAKLLKVKTDTVTNWELNRNDPQVSQYPSIIQFLGYYPFDQETETFGGKIRRYTY
ncbi:MAG: helix-turn-helix domain-containing protein [Rickettsiaceae bacterium]|nr:helix-turn-helix domain-containing protein [Rickettsiaceae bacterium]